MLVAGSHVEQVTRLQRPDMACDNLLCEQFFILSAIELGNTLAPKTNAMTIAAGATPKKNRASPHPNNFGWFSPLGSDRIRDESLSGARSSRLAERIDRRMICCSRR